MKLNEENVIEGRPNLNVDWEGQYDKQRRNRLVDAIYEYLDDVPADEFMQVVLDTIREYAEHHQRQLDVARAYTDAISTVC
jgi:hypothetical protein